MSGRKKRKDTGLFFDSFKHFKNNLSNLVGIELPTLCKLGAKSYINLIKANHKSKYPDMQKIGLIEYKKPSDNEFSLTQEGEFFAKNANLMQNSYNENSLKQGRKNIDSIKPSGVFSHFDLNSFEQDSYKFKMLQIILSYYDTADMIRPYFSLLQFIKEKGFKSLDKALLKNILAHSKEQILLKQYDENALNCASEELQTQLQRPISYIYNFLKTALIIDENCDIIVDYNLMDRVISQMNDFVTYQTQTQSNSRPAKEQRAFRDNVLKAYDYKCAITKESICVKESYLLEAAHIVPYKDGGSFATTNGIALSYEMHKMFDRGLFGFVYDGDKIKIQISNSPAIKDESGILDRIKNKEIKLPQKPELYPDKSALEYNLQKCLLR